MPARLANILSLRTTRILRVTDDSRGSEDFTDALKEGAISQREYSRVLRTDLIIRAQRHTARGIDLYIVVEASYTSDEDDLDKVILSAEVLRKVFPHTEVVAALYFTHISNQDLSATEIAEVIAIRAN